MATANSQTKTVKLSYQTVASDIAASRKALADLVKDMKSLNMWGEKVNQTYRSVGNGYKQSSQKAVEYRNQILKGTQALKEQITVLQRYSQAQNAASSGGGGGGGAAGGGGLGRALKVAGGAANLAGLDTAIPQLGQLASQAAPLISGLGATVAQVAVAAPLAAVAVVALALAAQKFTEDMEANAKRLQNGIATQKTYYELLQTGTTESIKLGLEELRVKLAVAEAVRRDIQNGQDQLKQFGIFQGFAEQFTGLKDQAKAADDEINSTRAQLDAFNRALGTTQVAANDAAEAEKKLAEERDKQNADSISAVKTYNADVARLNDQERQAEIDAEKRYADNQIRIAEQAADAAEDALRKLQDARANLATNAQRTEEQAQLDARRKRMDEQIAFQREEAKAARAHANDLIAIRRRADEQEFDLALNRDFAGISALRRDTNRQIDEANRQFNEEEQQRLEAFAQRLKDDQEQFIRERQDRLKRFKQQLTDLNAAYQKELQLINQRKRDQLQQLDSAYRAEVTQLRDKLTAELSLRRSAIVSELQLIAQGNQQRLALEAQYLQQARALLQSAIGGTTTNRTVNQTNNMTVNNNGTQQGDPVQRAMQEAINNALAQLAGP